MSFGNAGSRIFHYEADGSVFLILGADDADFSFFSEFGGIAQKFHQHLLHTVTVGGEYNLRGRHGAVDRNVAGKLFRGPIYSHAEKCVGRDFLARQAGRMGVYRRQIENIVDEHLEQVGVENDLA